MKQENTINRREFLQRLSVGAATVAAASAFTPAGKSLLSPEEAAKNEMTYRDGPRGDRVSLLGYGCMRWPTLPAKEGEAPELDQETINRLVDYALEHGVNYFDTAPAYQKGRSETATGIALKRYPRESYYIATKLSNSRPPFTKAAALEMYQASRRRLQTDYIDYYLLHNIGVPRSGETGIERFNTRFIKNGVLDYLLKEREAGRIRNLGYSVHCDRETFDYVLSLHEKYHWDFVQIQMNYADWKQASRRDDNEAEYMYNELTKRNIPIVIMEPLLGGRLASLNDHANARLQAREPEKSIASWAFRYCGTFPQILTVLSGMTYMEHLQDNLSSFCPLKPLTEEEIAMLYEIAEEYKKFPLVPCTACQYCMPCPYGLDIPGIFAHYNKCVNEGNISDDATDPDYRRARRAFLVGYDRSVPRLRQAEQCIGCGHCVDACPQRINIPQQMRRIDRYAEKLRSEK
ncbi:MAG: aldo/keto reductase [Bacteroidales bacterium]|nr:aldo/keto reductase [Bacteroidales bacterium]